MTTASNPDHMNAPAGAMLALTDGLDAKPGDVVCASTARMSGHGVAATTATTYADTCGEDTYGAAATTAVRPAERESKPYASTSNNRTRRNDLIHLHPERWSTLKPKTVVCGRVS